MIVDDAIMILKDQVEIDTNETDWSLESVTAGREELDPAIICTKKGRLPKLVMTHLFLYIEPDTGIDYVVFFIMDVTSNREYVRGLLIEGQLFWALEA